MMSSKSCHILLYFLCVWTPNRIPQSAAILRLFWTFSTASSSMSFMCFRHPPKTQSLGTQTDQKKTRRCCESVTPGPKLAKLIKNLEKPEYSALAAAWVFQVATLSLHHRAVTWHGRLWWFFFMEPGAMTLSWHLSKMWKKPCCHNDNRIYRLSCYLTIIQRSKGIVQLHLIPVCRIWWPSCQRKPHMEN